jgi:MoaA/NifB/PqqE/SkfB family radical SAM enzyme
LIPDYFKSPLILQWEITRACNLRCVFCYNNSGKKHPNELTNNKKINVAKQIVDAGIYRLCLGGGEPILDESFWDIANILKDGKVLCNTVSNGWWINSQTIPLYTKYFSTIQISIDGHKEDTHDKLRCRKGSWKRAVNACKLIVENQANLTIATVVTKSNLEEIGDLIDLSYKLGAVNHRIDEAMLIGRAAKNKNNITLSKKQYEKLIKIIKKKKKQYENTKFFIDILPKTKYSYVRAATNIPPLTMYISPTGTCAIDPDMPFSGGSLKDKNLKEIWDVLKKSHKNKEYIRQTQIVKTKKDFTKLDKIPYLEGELHD